MGRTVGQSQNLIDQAKVQIGKPPGYWKAVILDLLSLFSALGFGYSYFRYLTDGISPWWILAAGLLFSAFSVLQVFLAPKVGRRIFVLLGEAIAIVVWFAWYDDWRIMVLAGGLLFLMLMWGYFDGRADAANDIEVRFFSVSHDMLSKLTTGLLLTMLLVYAPQAQGSGIFLPRSSFKTFYGWVSGVLDNFYPGLPFNDTFGNFAKDIAQRELQNNPTFQNLNTTQQDAAVAQAVTNLQGTVAAQTGIAPKPNEQVSDVAYDYIVSMLGAWKDKFQDQFVVVWVIALFLILRTIAVLFVWGSQLASLLMYELLLATGFMHIAESTQTKEVVEY